MIYCCGGYYNPSRTVLIAPDFKYRDRKLEILICPKCSALIACLTQYNIETGKYEVVRPKRKKTANFIKKLEAGNWSEIKIKYGTREKSGFVYGINKEFKNGVIHQYAIDFNGVKKLVKVIN